MAQLIKNANIFGRIGSGIGQGLSEQVPKEIERNRLSSALTQVGNQQGQTPFQQFTGLVGAAHEYPQVVQSGAELLRQQGKGRGLANKASAQIEKPNPFQDYQQPIGNQQQNKGITSKEGIRATIENYIPKTREERLARAGELYQNEPQLYPTPDSAIQAVDAEENLLQQKNAALQGKRKGEQDVQSRIQNELKYEKGESAVPENVYDQVERKAIDAVASGEKTEYQAAKDGKKELDKISREYEAVNSIGKVGFVFRDKDAIRRNLNDIRQGFKERGDLENYADTLVAKNGLSYPKAYYLAYKPSDYKELNNELTKVPELMNRKNVYKLGNIPYNKINEKNEKMKTQTFGKLAKAMGKNGSPLAVGEELKSKGYDPEDWLQYLSENRKQLDLSERQGRELEKPKSILPMMNDTWLFLFSGLDKLAEQ